MARMSELGSAAGGSVSIGGSVLMMPEDIKKNTTLDFGWFSLSSTSRIMKSACA